MMWQYFRYISLSAYKGLGIGKRLLFLIIFFSSLITLIATGIQLYTDYRRDLGIIKTRLNDIESSYLVPVHKRQFFR